MYELNTKRPVLATVLAIIQTVIALLNIVVAVLVLVAMRTPEVAPHAAEQVHEFTLNAVMVVAAATLTSVAAVGLWKRWALGWALTLALGLTVTLGMLWGPVFDHDLMERDDIGVTGAFALTIVLALLPAVRHWYLRHASATTVPAQSANLKSGF